MAAAVAMRERTSFREILMGTLFGDEPGAVYGRSGPVAERQLSMANGGAPYGDPVEKGLAFTVREARNRLRELVSGAQKIRSIDQLVSYLRENFLTPEVRSYGGAGKGTIHLRDQVSGGSAPGAAVHPILSERGMRKLSGLDIAAAPAAPSPMEVRYRDALRLSYKGQPTAYSGWESMKTGLPTALSRNVALAYTVADGVAWVGRPGKDARNPLECLATPQRSREMLYEHYVDDRKAKAARMESDARDVEARAPAGPDGADERARAVGIRETARKVAATQSMGAFRKLSDNDQARFLSRHYVFDADMTPRTPILVRDTALVPAARISPELAADRMAAKFGIGFAAHWGDFHKTQIASRQEDREDNKVVDFRQAVAAMREGVSPAPAVLPGNGFGGIAPNQGKAAVRSSIVLVLDDRSPDIRICRYSPDGNHVELPQFSALHDLPPGDYRMLVAGATYNAPSGYVSVDADQGVTFMDAARREHNLDGPSHVPAPGAVGKASRWAVEGRTMDEGRWAVLANPPPEPEPAPGAYDEPMSGFGFGAPAA